MGALFRHSPSIHFVISGSTMKSFRTQPGEQEKGSEFKHIYDPFSLLKYVGEISFVLYFPILPPLPPSGWEAAGQSPGLGVR